MSKMSLYQRGLIGHRTEAESGSILWGMVSTEGDFEAGRANVAQLMSFVKKVYAALPVEEGTGSKYTYKSFTDKWGPAIRTVKDAYDEQEDRWARHVPFSPVKGTIKEIGNQAIDLMHRIAADLGLEAPKGLSESSGGFPWKPILIGGGVVFAAVVVNNMLKVTGRGIR